MNAFVKKFVNQKGLLLFGLGLSVSMGLLGGCSSQPRAELPPHIQAQRDAENFVWHESLNRKTEGKGFLESLDIQRQHQKEHGPIPR
jgi:hypothetical protein